MFDPSDYLDLANILSRPDSSDSLDEARQRSAISRAYYSVFIKARNKRCRPEAKHRDVAEAYILRGGADNTSFGDRLKQLYKERCNADYCDDIRDPSLKAAEVIEEARCLVLLLEKL